MKLLIHDYPGHAFPVQLARALAARGHEVLHVWSATFQSPKGPLARRADDPPTLRLQPLDLDRPVAKYSFVQRALQEREFGRKLAALVAAERPAVVIANGPLDILVPVRAACRRIGARFVYWLQDFYGIAIDRVVRRKLPVVGAAIGAWYRARERTLLAGSDWVVTISEDFRPTLEAMGVARARTTIVENWAAIAEIPPGARDNAWARANGMSGAPIFLYSGTLGLKHNPGLLLALARHLDAVPGARMVVVSEGIGADWLREHGKGVASLVQLPFQPHERFPDVLAAADVLVAILEPDAGVFSVPSKILAYLCAGRPVLAAIPPDNLAARIIAGNGAGLTASPDDEAAFLAAADRLCADAPGRAEMARKALDYAQRTFDIGAITARFEDVLARVSADGKP